jgi:hypothetical protein
MMPLGKIIDMACGDPDLETCKLTAAPSRQARRPPGKMPRQIDPLVRVAASRVKRARVEGGVATWRQWVVCLW